MLLVMLGPAGREPVGGDTERKARHSEDAGQRIHGAVVGRVR